jgi:hypothetical protein
MARRQLVAFQSQREFDRMASGIRKVEKLEPRPKTRTRRPRRGGGGSSTENFAAFAMVSVAGGAFNGDVGSAVPLGPDGLETELDPIEFKTLYPIPLQVGEIVELSVGGQEITPGSTWPDAPVFATAVVPPPIICKSPSSGIPGRAGVELSTGVCDIQHWTPATNDLEDSGESVPVYNLAESDVGGSVYIMAKSVGGRYIVDWEEC